MLRYALAALAAVVLVSASLIPDDAYARRGGGGYRGGGYHGGGAHYRGGAVHAGRYHGLLRPVCLALDRFDVWDVSVRRAHQYPLLASV